MNHDCNGDRFKTNGVAFYRCLADSTVTLGDVPAGTACPTCERPVCAVDQGELPFRTQLVREYEHPDHGWQALPAQLTVGPLDEKGVRVAAIRECCDILAKAAGEWDEDTPQEETYHAAVGRLWSHLRAVETGEPDPNRPGQV